MPLDGLVVDDGYGRGETAEVLRISAAIEGLAQDQLNYGQLPDAGSYSGDRREFSTARNNPDPHARTPPCALSVSCYQLPQCCCLLLP